VLAALGALAEFPELVTSIFLSGQTISDAGIYNVRFFIRGKPWVVTVDDYLLTNTNASPDTLVFTRPDPTTGAMWSTILEKAWAKIAGNYELSNGGYLENGLRSFTGVPVFTYWGDEILNTTASATLWATMKAADDVGYLLSAAVYFLDQSAQTNECGIV
jgi:hypothetical protein